MSEPILVVDIGTASSAAAIVADGRTALLRDPLTRSEAWPSALLLDETRWLAGTAAERRKRAAPRRYVDGPRRAVDTRAPLWLEHREVTGVEALTAYLSVIAGEARTVYGSPIHRVVLTVPGGYAVPDPRRDDLIAVGEKAGFADVELVDDAVAVALDPHTGTDLPGGSLVLVCDLGDTWNVACVRVRGEHSAVLSQRGATAGRDLDALLLADLRTEGRAWLEPLLSAPGDAGLRAYHDAVDFVRRLKHRLADADEVQDHLTPVTPAYRLTRQWLASFAEPAVETLLASCHAVVEDAGVALADIGAVILAGGAARLPMAMTAIGEALGHPPRRSAGPEFAAARGAARWAAGAAQRVVTASVPGWRTQPVVWDVPGGRARLLRWAVEPENPYAAGSVLAEIRTADDLIVGVTATDGGALLDPLPPPGALLGPVLAVAARRTPEALAADPPVPVRTHETAGSYLLRADRRVLLECGPGGSSVTSLAAATGEVLGVFTPEPTDMPAAPDGGRLFVDPDGRPALVAWDAGTGVSVFDVESGKLTTRIREAVGGRRFLVDESGWRLAVESEGRAAVGRYRRSTMTVWDLHTGGRLHRATDGGWEQRHPEFRPRSATDGFGLEAVSGGLAVAVRADGVLVTDTASGIEVFRAPVPPDTQARVAFDADGQRLLINTESAGRSTIDVFQV